MANATIGKLSVVLQARTAGFERGMRAAGRIAQRTARVVKAAAIGVAALGAGAGLAAAGGLAHLTRQQLAANDALAKNADRLGVSTGALAGMQHAADLAGVSGDKLNTSIQRMNRRLGEAAEGGGEAAGALASLGLDAKALADLPADRALAQIADRLNEVDNTARRSALAFDIFGRDGIELFTLFKNGSAGLADAAREAEKLGLAVSRVEAGRIEAANDAITRLRRVGTGIGRQLAVAVAPVLQRIADWVTRIATEGAGVGPKVRGAIAAVLTGAARLFDGLHTLRLGVAALEVRWLQWKSTALTSIKDIVDSTAGLSAALAALPGIGPLVSTVATATSAPIGARADEARREAQRAARRLGTLPLSSDLAATIRDLARLVLSPEAGGVAPSPAEQTDAQEDTTRAVHELTDAVNRQTDELTEALGNARGGANAGLLRILDRLAISTANPGGGGGLGSALAYAGGGF